MDTTKVHAFDEDGTNLSHAKLLPPNGSSSSKQVAKTKARRANGPTPKDFFKDASYDVDFTELLIVRKVCLPGAYDSFCAILIEIMDQELRAYYKGRYLLQIWQKDVGWKWEKVLKQPPRAWSIGSYSFVYKASLDDGNGERYLHTLYFDYYTNYKVVENSFKEYVENDPFTIFQLSSNGAHLYYASNHEVYCVLMSDIDKEKGLYLPTLIQPDKSMAWYLSVPQNLSFHMFRGEYEYLFADEFYNFFSASVTYKNGENNKGTIEFAYDFHNEPLKEKYYPIEKHINYYTKNSRTYDIILRKESKQVEVYLNFEKIYDSKDSPAKRMFTDIDINNDYIYLKTMNFTYQISTSSKIFEVTEEKITPLIRDNNWYYINQDKIRAHVSLFNDYTISGTCLYVAYEKMIFKYTFIDNKIRRYINKLQDEVDQIYAKNNKNEVYIQYVRPEQDSGSEEQKKPELPDLTKVDLYDFSSEKGKLVSTFEMKGKIVDQVYSMASDLQNIVKIFITQDKQENKYIYVLPDNDGIAEITSNITLEKSEKLIRYYTQYSGYTYQFGLISDEKKTYRKISGTSYGSVYSESYDLSKQTILYSLNDIIGVIEAKGGYYPLILTTSYIIEANFTENKYKTLLSNQNFNLKYLEIVDNQYLYYQNSEGLYCMNLSTLISKESPDMTESVLIQYTYIDQNYIICHAMNQRLCYLQHNQSLKIVPLAHENVIIPFGYNNTNGTYEENKVHSFKVIDTMKDNEPRKLVGIDSTKHLISWLFPQGKLLNKYKIGRILTDGFELFDNTDLHYKKCNRPALLYVREIPEEQKLEGENQNMAAEQKVKVKCEFKIIEISSDMDIELIASFEHQLNRSNDCLYFSEDFHKMIHMEMPDNYGSSNIKDVRIYSLKQDFEEDPSRTVVPIKPILNFPKEFFNRNSIFHMFSPDFSHFLDFDNVDQELKISRTIKTVDSKEDIIINFFDTIDSSFVPQKVFHHFRWISNNQFKIINEESVENLFDISTGSPVAKSCSLVPMKQAYYYYDQNFYYQTCIDQGTTPLYDRLLRKYQQQQMETQHTLYDGNIPPDFDYEFRYLPDYYYRYGKVQINMNYTYYHWKLAEHLIKQNNDNIVDKLGIQEIKLLLLNIFPYTKNTFLHKAVDILDKKNKDQGPESEKNDQSASDAKVSFNSKILKKMFKILYDDTGYSDFYFPFTKNDKGMTPFEILPEKNITSISVMLKYLKNQPIYYHTKDILSLLPTLMSLGIDVGEYLDSRIQQTSFAKKYATIFDFKPISMKNYQITSTFLWPDFEVFADQFKENPTTKKKRNCWERFINFFVGEKDNNTELDVKVEVLDIPYLNDIKPMRRKAAEQFFKALSDVDGYDLFKYKSVQYLIDYKWQSIRKYTMGLLLFPFLLYFLTFIVYSNVFNSKDELEGDWLTAFVVLSGILFFFSIYFLSNEFVQLFQNKLDYFTDSLVWNILDITPSLLIITVVSARLRQRFTTEEYEESTFLDTVHAVASLMMWLKFMYFLRLFESTGYLIRIVMNMVWDMKIFIFILFMVELGFGEAFLRLSEKSDEEGQFLENFGFAFIYAFRLTLGDNDTEAYSSIAQPITAWVLFVCCEVFTNIVMLNLLVTIIGQSFEQINENSKLANFKERAKLIYENSYLIKCLRCCSKRSALEKRDFLLIITDISNEDTDETSDVMKEIQENIKKLTTDNASIKSQMDANYQSLEKTIQSKFEELNNKVQNMSTEIINAMDTKLSAAKK